MAAHCPNGAIERPERHPEVLGSNLFTIRRICTPKTDPRAPHPAAVNTFHVRTVRTREGPVARAGNPVARSLGVQNTRIAVEFEIPRPARTSPRLKHATQKPTLLRQKISALIGSGIEAASEPTNCHVRCKIDRPPEERGLSCSCLMVSGTGDEIAGCGGSAHGRSVP